MTRMTRVPIHLLLIVAIFCTVAVYVKSDDATWTAVVSSDPDLQVIALEPTSFLDGEDYKALHFGDSFSGYKWILRLCLVSPHLSFSQISGLKQGQPILRC
jgi:hypothetical protein